MAFLRSRHIPSLGRWAIPLFLLLSVVLPSWAELPVDAEWFARHYSKHEHMIPMRDGCRLYTAVYTPADTTAVHPILFTRTPYGCHPYGNDPAALWQQDIMQPYLQAGYILVFQDVRGKYASEGEFVNIRPLCQYNSGAQIDEATDTYDTADWLVKHISHNNGRIGVYGNSYSGFYALMAGASHHPSIRAISPQAPVGDWWMGDDFHHNGALAVQDAVGFLHNFGVSNNGSSAGFQSPVQGDMATYLTTHTVADITRTLATTVPFWDEMASHPHYDRWWKARSSLNATRNMRCPVLIVGSCYDAEDAYGFWHIYRSLRRHNPHQDIRLVVGAWAHGAWRWNNASGTLSKGVYLSEPPSQHYIYQMEFPFFEHYLRDRIAPSAQGSAEVYFTGENRWRQLSAGWDPEKTCARRTLYLHDNHLLSPHPNAVSVSASHYLSDPSHPVPYCAEADRGSRGYMCASQSFLAGRPDVLQFETAPLQHAVTMAGAITANLYVTLSTTDADFVVKVIDCGPEGNMLVRAEIMRGRYRRDPSKPRAFKPGRIEQVNLSMPDVAHTFLPGHVIRVQIQSSWFPLFDLNPQCMQDPYTAQLADFVPCNVTIHHDKRHPSCINYYEWTK